MDFVIFTLKRVVVLIFVVIVGVTFIHMFGGAGSAAFDGLLGSFDGLFDVLEKGLK